MSLRQMTSGVKDFVVSQSKTLAIRFPKNLQTNQYIFFGLLAFLTPVWITFVVLLPWLAAVFPRLTQVPL